MKPNRKECRKYELDLTDYVRGDMTSLTREKQQKLFDHLRKCSACREEFFEWENTVSVITTEEHFARPETQKKYAEMLEKIKNNAGKIVPINVEWEIGNAAGKIFNCLKVNGPIMPIPLIRLKTGLLDFPFYEAVGWLAKEKKVTLARDEKTDYASLQPEIRV